VPGVRRAVAAFGVAEGAVLFVGVSGSGVAACSWPSLAGRGGASEPDRGVPGVRERLGVRARAFALGGLLQCAMSHGGVAAAIRVSLSLCAVA
jgi:hypothetical protein